MTKREDITSSRDVASRGLFYPQSLPVEDKLLLCRAVLALTEPPAPLPGRWRVGSKVPLNVYEGDRPVCQCHRIEDATRLVAAMNAAEAGPWEPLCHGHSNTQAVIAERELAALKAGVDAVNALDDFGRIKALMNAAIEAAMEKLK